MQTILPLKAATLSKPSGHLFLQRRKGTSKRIRKRANAAANLLQQIGWLAKEQVNYEQMQTVTINEDRILDFVARYCRGVFVQHGYGASDFLLFIGPKQLELIAEATEPITKPFCHEVQQGSLFGMLLCVLPWMDGILPVPKRYLPLDVKIQEVVRRETDEERREREGRERANAAAAAWNSLMDMPPTKHP